MSHLGSNFTANVFWFSYFLWCGLSGVYILWAKKNEIERKRRRTNVVLLLIFIATCSSVYWAIGIFAPHYFHAINNTCVGIYGCQQGIP